MDARTRRMGTSDRVSDVEFLFGRGWRLEGDELVHPEALNPQTSVAAALAETAAWDRRLIDAAFGSGYLAETCPTALPESFA
jgi:hypothetical protein